MEAIVFGLAAAGFWAITSLVSARASRSIGAGPTLGLVMLLGLAIAVPAVLASETPTDLGPAALAVLLVAGLGNVTGLFLQCRGVQTGQVGVVVAISSTEGASPRSSRSSSASRSSPGSSSPWRSSSSASC